MIYVILDVYKGSGKTSYEKRLTKGPYTRLFRGYGGEINGERPDGNKDECVFEATVGRGGSCDTCAYDYPDFGMSMRAPFYEVEVKHFEIVEMEE